MNPTADSVPTSKGERIKLSHGQRKHFKGKMVQPSGGPRAHTHGGNSASRVGWTCGDQAIAPEIWKLTPGRYKVQLDRRLQRKGGEFERSAA